MSHTDITSTGEEVEKDRPSGPDAEHLQYSKTLNGPAQRRMRDEKKMKKAVKAHTDAIETYNFVRDILARNREVEKKLLDKIDGDSLADATVSDFMPLNCPQLKDFIHCRKFIGKTFQESKLVGSSGKLNKTLRKKQSAQSIESECSEDEPCLVWLAWNLRSDPLVLIRLPMPVLCTSLPTPSFRLPDSTSPAEKFASNHLLNSTWVNSFSSVVKGVSAVTLDETIRMNADKLSPALEQRLGFHIDRRVDKSKQDHFFLEFASNNTTEMAAAFCLFGHAVPDTEACTMEERLLVLPSKGTFHEIDDELRDLEGCYLYNDSVKDKWIRSGFTSGDGEASCYRGRHDKHQSNATSPEEMRKCQFYRRYPSRDATEDSGAWSGYFENLRMFCGMAFDKKGEVRPLCSIGKEDSLFVWSDRVIEELKKRAEKKGVSLQRMQLTAVAYLWEMYYELMLARSENVSKSPGAESLGLRVNNKNTRKRSRED